MGTIDKCEQRALKKQIQDQKKANKEQKKAEKERKKVEKEQKKAEREQKKAVKTAEKQEKEKRKAEKAQEKANKAAKKARATKAEAEEVAEEEAKEVKEVAEKDQAQDAREVEQGLEQADGSTKSTGTRKRKVEKHTAGEPQETTPGNGEDQPAQEAPKRRRKSSKPAAPKQDKQEQVTGRSEERKQHPRPIPEIPVFQHSTIVMYWSRDAVGLKLKTQDKKQARYNNACKRLAQTRVHSALGALCCFQRYSQELCFGQGSCAILRDLEFKCTTSRLLKLKQSRRLSWTSWKARWSWLSLSLRG